ncbi:MAG: hypothetical protein GX333_02755 [Syntrophomonadaceae bacterium]|nr:hypothetical protein [Syntrophomonadaceae bacterium]
MTNNIMDKLLEDNLLHNNYRVINAMIILIVLIIPVTAFLKIRGLASSYLTMFGIIAVTLFSSIIIIIAYIIIKNYGKKYWTKWAIMVAVFSIFMSYRTIAHGAVETHSILYLAIILAVFYFDYKLVLFTTGLCIIGDYVLLLYYPQSLPSGDPYFNQSIRYLNYLWVGLAASIGTHAAKQLLQLSTELKSANDSLLRDIEKERQLERVLKEFIAAVSHESKSPLGIVQGYAEAVKDGVKPDKQEQYMDTIIDEVEHMSNLITNMLDLSQLENGYIKFNLQEFELYSLVDKVILRYMSLIEQKNLQIIIENKLEEAVVVGDKDRITICLANLLTNAIQQTPANKRIFIKLIENENKIFCLIENEGQPIEDEDLQKIWLPFYRTEKSRNKEYGGTGLGLAITQNILTFHNSTYGIKNTSEGVCFYFSLNKTF